MRNLWRGLSGLLLPALAFGSSPASPSPASPSPAYPISLPLDGPKSRYTDALLSLLSHWPPPDLGSPKAPAQPASSVQLRCYATKGHQFAIGVSQVMWVDAPPARVATVLDDVDHYAEIFDGYVEVKTLSKDANRWVTYWEQRIPVPFVPNVKYEMTYLIGEAAPGRRVYRYQLKSSNKITQNDGIIVLESFPGPGGRTLTRYVEYDFWDADWGILKTIAPGRIWKDSVEGVAASDYAVKLKAENPSWPNRRVLEESKRAVEKDEKAIESCIAHPGVGEDVGQGGK